MCRKLCHFIWGIWWFHRWKDFEAMKAGKLAFRPWLICPYNENMLMDLPSSVNSTYNWWILFRLHVKQKNCDGFTSHSMDFLDANRPHIVRHCYTRMATVYIYKDVSTRSLSQLCFCSIFRYLEDILST